MKQFLNHINTNFPGTRKDILVNYRLLLEGRDDKSDRYVKIFLSAANDHIDAIVARDSSALFASGEDGKYNFIQGVNLHKLWMSDYNTEEVQGKTWRFLQLLLRLSRAFIPNRDEIRALLQEVSDGQISAPAKLDSTLNDDNDEDDEEGIVGAPDIFGLGKLAGLAGLAGIGNGEAPDLSSLLKMGADMMSNLGLTESQIAEASSTMGEEADMTTSNNVKVDTESATETSDTTASAETGDATATMPNPLESVAANPKVMEFVEKMKANMDANGIDENNPAAVFQHLAKTGFNPENMSELMDVSKELLGGLGGEGGLGSLLQGIMGGGKKPSRKQMRNAARRAEQINSRRGGQSTTRERLRAKLDAKRAAEEASAAPVSTNNEASQPNQPSQSVPNK